MSNLGLALCEEGQPLGCNTEVAFNFAADTSSCDCLNSLGDHFEIWWRVFGENRSNMLDEDRFKFERVLAPPANRDMELLDDLFKLTHDSI